MVWICVASAPQNGCSFVGAMENKRTVLTSKAAREAAIFEVLQTQEITSQQQLAQVLQARGLTTTQATLSRDLLALRATKLRNAAGRSVYTVPGSQPYCSRLEGERGEVSRLSRLCLDLLISAEAVNNQLVLRTPPGGAELLASGVDSAWFDSVLGCIAGDNTVLVICRSEELAQNLCERFVESINWRTQHPDR